MLCRDIDSSAPRLEYQQLAMRRHCGRCSLRRRAQATSPAFAARKKEASQQTSSINLGNSSRNKVSVVNKYTEAGGEYRSRQVAAGVVAP